MNELTLEDLKKQNYFLESVALVGSMWTMSKPNKSTKQCSHSEVIFNGVTRIKLGGTMRAILVPWKVSLKWIDDQETLKRSDIHHHWTEICLLNVKVFDDMGYEQESHNIGNAIQQILINIRPDFHTFMDAKIMGLLVKTPLFSSFNGELNDFDGGGHLRNAHCKKLLSMQFGTDSKKSLNFYQVGENYAIEKIINESVKLRISAESIAVGAEFEKSIKIVQVFSPESIQGVSEVSSMKVWNFRGLQEVLNSVDDDDMQFQDQLSDYIFKNNTQFKAQYLLAINKVFRA